MTRPKHKLILVAGLIACFMAAGITSAFADPSWSSSGNMTLLRADYSAVLMSDGVSVLVIGGDNGNSDSLTYFKSTELYNGSWTSASDLNHPRAYHTSTMLFGDNILVFGGFNDSGYLNITELYNGTSWSTDIINRATARAFHSAVKLSNGKVLIIGGQDYSGHLKSCYLFDPSAKEWSSAGPLWSARVFHTTTLLPDSKVLVTGGYNSTAGYLKSCEIYDPASNTWTEIAPLNVARHSHTATLLNNGKVLVTGGLSSGGVYLDSSEIYDPATNQWILYPGSLSVGRYGHSATLLKDGRVLIAGGSSNIGDGDISSSVIYDPDTEAFTPTGTMTIARAYHQATLLTDANGKVLVTGGINSGGAQRSSETYDPDTAAITVSSITGEVTNSLTNSPVEGAKVTIGIFSATTGIDGIYSISNIIGAGNTLTAVKEKLKSVSQTVTLAAGPNIINLEMSPPDSTITVAIDSGSPISTNNSESSSANFTPNLAINVWDANSLSLIKLIINGVEKKSLTFNVTENYTLSYSVPLYDALKEGKNTITIQTTNSLGGQTSFNLSITPNPPDIIAPVITVDTAIPSILDAKSITIKGKVQDSRSNINSVRYSLNGGDWLPAVTDTASLAENFTITLDSLEDGDYVLKIKSDDIAANTKEQSYNFTVNAEAPALTAKIGDGPQVSASSTNYGIVSSAPKLEITARDGNGIDSIKILINGTEKKVVASSQMTAASTGYSYSYDFPASEPLKEGTNTITIQALDTQGKQSSLDMIVESYTGTKVVGTPYNYPNPFKPSAGDITNIVYTLTADVDINILIYDISHKLVTQKACASKTIGGSQGENEVPWDGTTDFGGKAANGVYLYFITSGNKVLGKGQLVVYE